MRTLAIAAALAASPSLIGVAAASAGDLMFGPPEAYLGPPPVYAAPRVYEPPEVIVKERTYIVRRPPLVAAPIYAPRRAYAIPEAVYGEPYPTRRVTKKSITIEEGPGW